MIHLVRAVNELRKEFPLTSLSLIGPFSVYEKDYELEIKLYVKEKGLENFVSFEGFVTGEEKIRLLRNATIVVHPSRLETFCLSVTEAMATGTPVVVTRVGGLPYTVGGEKNSILVSFGSSEELASAIANLFRREDRRKELGKMLATQARKRFHPSVVIPELVRVYEDVMHPMVVTRVTLESMEGLFAAIVCKQ